MASTQRPKGRPPRRVVILEPDAEGHPREWLRHLIRYSATMDAPEAVWFVVAPEVYAELAVEPAVLRGDHIHLLPLEPDEQRLCRHRSLVISGLARWWTMRKYLRRTGAEAGHFLSIDHLSLPLALGLGAGGCRLGGILFRPSTHYPMLGPYRPSLKERVRDLRKTALYRLMLLNRAVRVILTLDPYFPDYAALHYVHGAKMRAVPDPTHPPMNATADEHQLAELIPADRVTFLLFGHLTERKGVMTLLKALRYLPDSAASRIAIVLAGKVEAEIRDRLASLYRGVLAEKPELWIHLEDRRVSSGELQALIARTDAVLAPYQRFVGSSGVLLWAAGAGKPIITQDYGLIGRLVRDHQLGLAADVTDPKILADAIVKMTAREPRTFINQTTARNFAAERTPHDFAALVFASLLQE
jgi:glycosyltransferase involved in cell wall biosynthesis